MSDDLLDRLLETEPPFATTGADLRRRAAGVRTRRRVWTGATAAVVAAAAVLAGTQALDGPDQAHPVAPEQRFDPDTLAADLSAVVGAVPGAGAVEVHARADGPGPLTGDDRDRALLWYATADLGDDAHLRVGLEHLDQSRQTAEDSCAREREIGMSLSCEVQEVGGAVVTIQVRPVRQGGSPDAFVVRFGPRADRVRVDRRWLQRRIVAYHPDGTAVAVNEYVRVPTIDQAAWPLDEAEALAISLRADLDFPDVSGPGGP